MTVYAIAQGRIDDRDMFEEYAPLARATLEAHEVKVIAFAENAKMIEGSTDFPRTIILEFESQEAFYRWYESPEYQAARDIRVQCCQGAFALVEGTAEDADDER
ncbi:MAG: DUF1330 domain-containing protein [Gammaproteobacteria bacterium]